MIGIHLIITASRHTNVIMSSPIFFFNDTATTEIYTLSLHDALPIYIARAEEAGRPRLVGEHRAHVPLPRIQLGRRRRSEEHTSELQSRLHLVCRLLLEKKKKIHIAALSFM